MGKKQYEELPLPEIMRKLKRSGVETSKHLHENEGRAISWHDSIEDLDTRISKLLGIIKRKERKATNMIFFVMYDIESDKVRTQIAKYLQREGCTRIQNSIFLADLPHEKMDKIRTDLAEVQACYDNHDSILVVPISTDYLQAMKVIGKDINVDIILKTRNTLFF